MFRFISFFISLVFLAVVMAAAMVLWVFWTYGRDLPDYQQLANYDPPVVTRIHAGDGALLAEYANEKRLFVPVRAMPPRLVEAFVSAEDKGFYQHFGVDLRALARAAVTNLLNYGTGRRPIGASTITQQVTKNFLLTNELSIERKIKEAILSLRMERAFSKNQILELYLNEIYLGMGSYGVAAAALNYFDKPLDQLALAEIAYLAALPKAPNNYHPVRNNRAAVARRNWVLDEMRQNGYISDAEAEAAKSEPLVLQRQSGFDAANAPYFTEEVRRQLLDQFGQTALYDGGCLCAPRLIRIYSNWRMMRLNAALKPLTVGKGGGGRWDACGIMQTLMRRWPAIHKSYAPTIMPRWSPRLPAGPPIFMCRGAMPKYRFNWHFGPIPLVTKMGCAHRHYRICEMHWRSMTSLLCNRPALHPI